MLHREFFRVIALYCIAVLVNGQCTLPSCTKSASASVENIVAVLEEHDDKLQSMYKNLSSTFEQLARHLEENVQQIDQRLAPKFEKIDQTLERDLKEQNEQLKTIHHNMSTVFEMLSAGGPKEEDKCQKIEEQQQFLEIMNSSFSVKVERIQVLKEDFERRFEAHNQRMMLAYQNVSAQIEVKLNQHLKITQQIISNISVAELERRVEAHDQSVRLIHQNISAHIDEKLSKQMKAIQQTLSNASMTDDTKFDALQTANDKITAQVMEQNRMQETQMQMMLTMQGNFASALGNLTERLNAGFDQLNESLEIIKTQVYCKGNSELCDCSTIRANGYTSSGEYRIYVNYQNKRYYANAYCGMTTSNSSWTVFQRRKDGSVDFYRGWNEYKNGFGDPNGEFWLGNDFIHLLTSKRTYRLRIDLEDFEGNRKYAEYSTFNISSSADKYRLSIGTYSGNAGDGLYWHNGDRFTTKDSDNDAHSSVQCAHYHSGAWWYNNCASCNLNGIYKHGNYSDCNACGILWVYWRGWRYSMKTTEMKISPVV